MGAWRRSVQAGACGPPCAFIRATRARSCLALGSGSLIGDPVWLDFEGPYRAAQLRPRRPPERCTTPSRDRSPRAMGVPCIPWAACTDGAENPSSPPDAKTAFPRCLGNPRERVARSRCDEQWSISFEYRMGGDRRSGEPFANRARDTRSQSRPSRSSGCGAKFQQDAAGRRRSVGGCWGYRGNAPSRPPLRQFDTGGLATGSAIQQGIAPGDGAQTEYWICALEFS